MQLKTPKSNQKIHENTKDSCNHSSKQTIHAIHSRKNHSSYNPLLSRKSSQSIPSFHKKDLALRDNRVITSSNFIEQYFFYPKLWHKVLSFMLLPFSCMYYCFAILRKKCSATKDFGIKIISIGNLVSGGSGKTPFCIALIKHLENLGYNNIFVILRGYKRHSKGLQEVSSNAHILCDVKCSGDEAMLIAQNIQGSVIVCENRERAIQHALKHNANLIILDDAYRFSFKKFDILLEPILLPYFDFVLPSGYYRFPPSFYKRCDLHLKEGEDYTRKVQILYQDSNPTTIVFQTHTSGMTDERGESMEHNFILATAIANPIRLDPYLPNNIATKYYLPDHAEFDEKILQNLLKQHNATHILMTQKDYVKCQDFSLPIAILLLEMHIQDSVFAKIKQYLQG